MKKVYTSAQGKSVDIDSLRIANEHTIAIGNMKVNARGDELGPGGSIVATRNQSMDAYYKLNTPVASDAPIADVVIAQSRSAGVTVDQGPSAVIEDIQLPEELNVPIESTTEVTAEETTTTPIRGSLAGSVAKQATVTQELLTPPSKKSGITRI